jgi:hypothetical protein
MDLVAAKPLQLVRVERLTEAVGLLKAMLAMRTSDFVFPKMKADSPLSVITLEMVLRRMKIDATVHGFRSTFRDWTGERTASPRKIAEAALAHLVGDEVEGAYRRGDALDRQRSLMEATLPRPHLRRALALRPARG